MLAKHQSDPLYRHKGRVSNIYRAQFSLRVKKGSFGGILQINIIEACLLEGRLYRCFRTIVAHGARRDFSSEEYLASRDPRIFDGIGTRTFIAVYSR